LACTEASFATNFVAATPTEAVSPSSPWMVARIRSPMAGGGPNSRVAPPVSRNASSSDSGSTTGVIDSRISRNRFE
jgi:hypothetical protein